MLEPAHTVEVAEEQGFLEAAQHLCQRLLPERRGQTTEPLVGLVVLAVLAFLTCQFKAVGVVGLVVGRNGLEVLPYSVLVAVDQVVPAHHPRLTPAGVAGHQGTLMAGKVV